MKKEISNELAQAEHWNKTIQPRATIITIALMIVIGVVIFFLDELTIIINNFIWR